MSGALKPAAGAAAQVVKMVSPEREAPAEPLSFHVKQAMERYFVQLNGHTPGGLYDFVLGEVERPLLEVVMKRTRGNISKAAQYLGLNRATLRKKLARYGLNQ
ncbi:MAG: DNA-binding transcriptional regulator Fis [Gammaproteobacteria bacterium]